MKKHISTEDLKQFLSTYHVAHDSINDIQQDMTQKFKEFYDHEFMLGVAIDQRHSHMYHVDVVTFDNTTLVCATYFIHTQYIP